MHRKKLSLVRDPPSISVILPTQAKNVEYLHEALQSVLEQTFQDFEMLVLFDGVTHERATEVLADFKDVRIRPIISLQQRGLPRILNIGGRLAKAPLLARMDDDDRCLPSRLEKQLDVMRREQIDVIGTWCWTICAKGQRLSSLPLSSDPSTPFSPIKAVFGRIFAHPSVMMRREWLLKHKYDPHWKRGQDRELWVRAAPMSYYSTIKEPLLEYRQVTTVTSKQMVNVKNAYKLIWRYRRRFGAWVPLLTLANFARQSVYWLKIRSKGRSTDV